jgi:hypothetical protein
VCSSEYGGAEKPLPVSLIMKRTFGQIIFILALSLCISLIYTAASPSGLVLLKKAFRISVPVPQVSEKPDSGGVSEGNRK